MNAIKLPVEAYHDSLQSWHVTESDGIVMCPNLSEEQANQIALALNCHDTLVDALAFYARNPSELPNRAQPGQPGTFNDWCAEIGPDGGDTARAALAKVEDLRKKV